MGSRHVDPRAEDPVDELLVGHLREEAAEPALLVGAAPGGGEGIPDPLCDWGGGGWGART